MSPTLNSVLLTSPKRDSHLAWLMLQSVKELLPPDSDLVTLTRSQAGFSLFRIGAIKIIILYLLTKKSEINFPAISTSLSFLLLAGILSLLNPSINPFAPKAGANVFNNFYKPNLFEDIFSNDF